MAFCKERATSDFLGQKPARSMHYALPWRANLSNREPVPDPSLAAERVVQRAVELARAELGLVGAHVRSLLVKAIATVLAVMLAAAAVQAALILIALSPVLFEADGWSGVLLALSPAVALSGLTIVAVAVAWRQLRNAAIPPGARGES
jgi:hypothetical protein